MSWSLDLFGASRFVGLISATTFPGPDAAGWPRRGARAFGVSTPFQMYQLAIVRYGRHASARAWQSRGLGSSASPCRSRSATRTPRSLAGKMSGRLRAKIRNISAVQTPIPLTAVSASVIASSSQESSNFVERNLPGDDGLGQVEHVPGLGAERPTLRRLGLAELDQPRRAGAARRRSQTSRRLIDAAALDEICWLMIERTSAPKRSGCGSSRQGPTRSMIARKCGSTRRRCRTAAAQRFRAGARGTLPGARIRGRVERRRFVSIFMSANSMLSLANATASEICRPQQEAIGLGCLATSSRRAGTNSTKAAAVPIVTRSRAISRVCQVSEIGLTVQALTNTTAPTMSKAIDPRRAPTKPAIDGVTDETSFSQPDRERQPSRGPESAPDQRVHEHWNEQDRLPSSRPAPQENRQERARNARAQASAQDHADSPAQTAANVDRRARPPAIPRSPPRHKPSAPKASDAFDVSATIRVSHVGRIT